MMTLSNFPEKIELDDVFDCGLISLMTKSLVTPESFYLTGYETISFKRTREFALETVLASVIPFEKDLLIVSNNIDDLRLQRLCTYHGVSSSIIKKPQTLEDWEEFKQKAANYRLYSHVLVSCDVNDAGDMEQLMEITTLVDNMKIGLIVHCRRKPMALKQVSNLNVDYMICNGTNSDISSVVLARRSRLVQTEGNARDSRMDLYNYWQSTLYGRNSYIEPMAI
ncbi:hypothetical protein [Carboxylicivirga linearis]|uniref:Uncharacterized protein n=1 Tax=Carboxylicivirga linearis TaxID=1628157 RepID=A0ABS5JP35_9BACT|nr:hypothetical protein [Carboxylicivirga linearis]MBS2096670.1 hypothetical protein [Carboxylicivirga linearis]